MKNLSKVEKAERVLKGYCNCCYMPKDQHSETCVHFDWEAGMMQRMVQEITAEIDREIIETIKAMCHEETKNQ